MRALIILATVVAGTLLGTAPAAAAPNDVFVEVSPGTIPAGDRVGLRASCPDNGKPATVRSDAFGQVEVRPRFGFLVRSVTVPAGRDTRTYTVRLTCPGGQTATATLHVVRGERATPTPTRRATRPPTPRPTRGPATGFGGTAGGGLGGGLGVGLVTAGLVTIAAGLVLGLLTVVRRRAHG